MNTATAITLKPRPGFPLAPSRPIRPITNLEPMAQEHRETSCLLNIVQAQGEEITALKTQLARAEAALDFYRSKARKPVREFDRIAWFKAALLGHAPANPMRTMFLLMGQLVRERVVGWYPCRRV
jgi:hypothetical protein